jgi:hypothetical protein
VNSDFKCIKNKSPSVISHTGVVAMAETELVEKSEVTISTSACKHNFGFLSKRDKGAAMPEECFTCEKMLDCMISKTKVTQSDAETEQTSEEQEREEQGKEVTEITEKTIPLTSEAELIAEHVAQEQERELVAVPAELEQESIEPEEIEENTIEDKPKTFGINLPRMPKIAMPKLSNERVTRRIGQIRTLKLRIRNPLEKQVEDSEPSEQKSAGTSNNDFRVETAGALYNHWSGTVLISKQTVDSWGGKIKEVELQTEKGRVTVCKIHTVSDLPPLVVQVPTKVKFILNIEDGANIKIRPLAN